MFLKIFKRSLLIATILVLFLTSWFVLEFLSSPKNPPKTILFEIEKGKGAKSLAQNLKDKDIIQKKWVFLLGYSVLYSARSIKAGEYAFSLPLPVKEILEIITEGRVHLHALTIPEGLTRLEIAEHLESLGFSERQAFLKASASPDPISDLDPEAANLEGYLFPETYFFPKGVTVEKIVSSMVSQFRNTFSDEWKERAGQIDKSIREVIVLASLIEKETSLPEERPLVSAVFHNRLQRRMKLDCDPTIIYALKLQGKFKDRLRTKDLQLDSPYNTYLYGGLPPGPIANPGRDSIAAALFPAETDYLYFVSKNDGSHCFSRTFREHQNAVNVYQKRKR
ncbi:MAG: endolytic transglycosylase MltG [Candidatus Aminicenantes bacterium]|jgi:UPF0755 protein